MYFGGASFAAAPFGATAGQSIRSVVTGSRVNLNTGTPTIAFGYPVTGSRINANSGSPTIVGKATVEPSGSQANINTGTVTISADANFSVTGSRVNLTIGNADV